MLTCFCYSGWIQWAVRSKHVPALPRWLKHICECGWLGFVGWSSCVSWIVAAWPIFLFSSRFNWHLECGSSLCTVPRLLVPFVIWMPTCTSDEQMASWPAVIYLPGLPTHTWPLSLWTKDGNIFFVQENLKSIINYIYILCTCTLAHLKLLTLAI